MTEEPEYKDTITKLRIKSRNVAQRAFTVRPAGYTKQDLDNLVADTQTELREEFPDRNLMFKVAAHYNLGWRCSTDFPSTQNFNSSLHIVDTDVLETHEATQFCIYIWNTDKPAGGHDDLFNDCLYNCIKSVISEYRFPKDYKKFEQLKQLFVLLAIKGYSPFKSYICFDVNISIC